MNLEEIKDYVLKSALQLDKSTDNQEKHNLIEELHKIINQYRNSKLQSNVNVLNQNLIIGFHMAFYVNNVINKSKKYLGKLSVDKNRIIRNISLLEETENQEEKKKYARTIISVIQLYDRFLSNSFSENLQTHFNFKSKKADQIERQLLR